MNERDLFMEALEKTVPSERAAYLDETCGSDVDLRERIEALLGSHEEAGSFLVTPVSDRLADRNGLPRFYEETAGMAGEERVSESLDFFAPSEKPGSLGRLAHYEVLEVIGRGGFGIVVRAFDEKLQRIVAIKILGPDLVGTSPPRKRFLREARAAAAIRQDNVVNIFSVEEEPIPHLVMEYIDGPTLQQKLDATGPLELSEIVAFGRQIASGLAAAHAMRLIHRDIKPGNILLENGIEPRVTITDFGLARAVDDASLTQSGVVAGTPMYMAPEQACGAVLDHRADLFSFGSVLYVMCTGRPPFRASSCIAVLKRVVEDVPRPIQELIPETPRWLCDIIGKLHAKEPEDRFESAQEVADLLGRCWSEMQQGPVSPLPGITSPPKKAQVVAPRSTFTGTRWATAAVLLLVLFAGLGLSEATGLSNLATTIIRIATGEGTLVIESSDPSVKLLIDGEQVTISGAGVEEVRLRPGSYKLAAMRDGKPIKLDQELVTISRDGRQVVRVLLEPEPVKVAEALPITDAWVSLFDGKDLTGWQIPEEAPQWLVKDKILTSGGPAGYLFSERSDYEDFHLRAEVRINSQGNSGILVRTMPPTRDPIFNGHRYRLVKKVVSWDQAKAEAAALGGHLATITSQAEDNWMRQQFGTLLTKNNTGFWLGASQATPDAPWKWVTEEPFTYTNWAANEPNCRSMKEENQTPYFLNLYSSASYSTQFGWNDSGSGPNTTWKPQSIGYLVEWDSTDSLPATDFASEFNRPGYEAQICADIAGQPKTGSLIKAQPWTCVAKVDPSPVPPGIWFKLDIIAQGSRFVVKVNDVQTAEHTTPHYLQGGGHIALQQYNSQTRVEFRKIEIREFAPFRPETYAFVRLGRPGIGESRYDTLEQAVKASKAGDTIEIHGNGPFVTNGISVKHPLTIRAADSFRPVIQQSRLAAATRNGLIGTVAPLILEGVTLERSGDGGGSMDKSIPYGSFLQGRFGGVIYAANCRFLNGHGPCFQIFEISHSTLPECKTARVLNSECLSYKVAEFKETPGGKYDVENSVLAGWIVSPLPQTGSDLCLNRLARNTLLSGGNHVDIEQFPTGTDPMLRKPGIRIDSTSNIYILGPLGLMVLSPDSPPLASELESFTRRSIEWHEMRNLYGAASLPLKFTTRDWKPIPSSLSPSLDEWNDFWNQDDTGSVQGAPKFQGGDLPDRAYKSLNSLTAEDFRLLPDSPGYRAGADGKDLGPDIDLVGPGEAYSRWKKTPEYQEWLKETQPLVQDFKGMTSGAVEPVQKLKGCSQGIWGVAHAQDGKSVFAISAEVLVHWNSKDGRLLAAHKLTQPKHYYQMFIPLKAGNRVITSNSGRLRLWDMTSEECLREFVGHSGLTHGLAVSPDERLLLSGTDDKTIRLWAIETGEQLHQFAPGTCRAAAFSPDGKRGAFGTETNIIVFDVPTWESLRELRGKPGAPSWGGMPRCLSFSPNNKHVLAGKHNGELLLCEVETGKQIHEALCQKQVFCCGFLPDGRHYFASSEDKTLRVFNTVTGKEVWRVEAATHCTNFASVSPDGRTIATGGGGYRDPITNTLEPDGNYDVHVWQLPESLWPNSETTPVSNPKSTPVAPAD